MNVPGRGDIASFWLVTGLIMAVLDALDVLQLGIISLATTQCAKTGDVACLSGGIERMVLFAVDVVVGPILLAANLISNFGPIGIILGLGILFIVANQK